MKYFSRYYIGSKNSCAGCGKPFGNTETIFVEEELDLAFCCSPEPDCFEIWTALHRDLCKPSHRLVMYEFLTTISLQWYGESVTIN